MSRAFRSSLAAGVDALITVGDPILRAQEALQNLLINESYASPAAVRLVLAEHRERSRRDASPTDVALSKREREVLQSMVDGLTTKATARRLNIAVKTVEAHRARIFTRLHVHTQAQAVRKAITDPELLGTTDRI
jgi:DNA-binding NarL/FixJ family response regulator